VTQVSLADHSLAQVSERLSGYGSSLQGEAEAAIYSLLKALESGLKGALEDAYHLSSIDPGLGKSLSVATLLQSWKESAFKPASSVLIGLSRLAEIHSYLAASGLDREDVAVLTSQEEFNALGLPEAQHGNAPVMFTTQQMIERRTRGRTFGEAEEFHYQGKPRSLRIWDESLIPSEPLTLRIDEAACLPASLRTHNPEFIASLQSFLAKLWTLKDRDRLKVPDELLEMSAALKGNIATNHRAILDTLGRLAGQTVAIVNVGSGNMHLAGASQPLPSDFSPVVILDASGRVRETYRVWERELGNLRRLPEAVKNYENLQVNLWERAVGQTAIKEPGAEEEVVRAVAEVVDSAPDQDWLVVHYKDHPVDERVRAALKHDLGDRLNFLHWGNHHGTNDYEHCRNVILIGQLTYGPASYPAHAAACGAAPSIRTAKLEQKLKAGEYRHNLLQALTRASVRRSKGGLAGSCRAYVIASPGTMARELLETTFPGCAIETWAPTGPEVGGHAGKLIAILKEAASRPGEHRFAKKALRETLGINTPNFARLLDHEAVAAHCTERGVTVLPRALVVHGTAFGPYAGEDDEESFSVEDLVD
jgi:hypothetical protein